MRLEFEELELPFDEAPSGDAPPREGPADHLAPIHNGTSLAPACTMTRDPRGTFSCCPLCGGELRPEHAHFRCDCGWRDSCCD